MLDLIEENIEIMGGKPVIKGTRVTVEAILLVVEITFEKQYD